MTPPQRQQATMPDFDARPLIAALSNPTSTTATLADVPLAPA